MNQDIGYTSRKSISAAGLAAELASTRDQEGGMGASSMAAPAAEPLHDLILKVQTLERRIDNIEQRLGDLSIPVAPAATIAPERWLAAIPGLPPNFLSVLGRVLLIVAGAYVFRSITDFGLIPRAAGIGIGILYGLACLVVAARIREDRGSRSP